MTDLGLVVLIGKTVTRPVRFFNFGEMVTTGRLFTISGGFSPAG
jgi:hypothetical protein